MIDDAYYRRRKQAHQTLTTRDFCDAKDAAKDMYYHAQLLFPILQEDKEMPPRTRKALEEELEKLTATDLSDDGIFGVVEKLTPQQIGPKEEQWFRNVARFGRHLINALAMRPLHDQTPVVPLVLQLNALGHINVGQEILSLNHAIQRIDRAFPPVQGWGLSRN